MSIDLKFETTKDYFLFEKGILLNLIETDYPRYVEYLEGYWNSVYKHFNNKKAPEEYSLGIANRKLREAYKNIENSILSEIQTEKGYKEFEKTHYLWQKEWLLKKIKEYDPNAIKEAKDVWQDIFEDVSGVKLEDDSTYFPEYKKANNTLRKYCAYVIKKNSKE